MQNPTQIRQFDFTEEPIIPENQIESEVNYTSECFPICNNQFFTSPNGETYPSIYNLE